MQWQSTKPAQFVSRTDTNEASKTPTGELGDF